MTLQAQNTKHDDDSALPAQKHARIGRFAPTFLRGPGYEPPLRCVETMREYRDSLWIRDDDLLDSGETLHVRVIAPDTFFVASPATIAGRRANGIVPIAVQCPALQRYSATIMIAVEVRDATGSADTIRFRLGVSEIASVLPLRVFTEDDTDGATSQYLQLGFAFCGATSGYEAGSWGSLDTEFCEWELPPVPLDIFDVRWQIPPRHGLLRSILPRNASYDDGPAHWRARISYPQRGAVRASRIHVRWSRWDADGMARGLVFCDPSNERDQVVMSNAAVFRSDRCTLSIVGDSIDVSFSATEYRGFDIVDFGCMLGTAIAHDTTAPPLQIVSTSGHLPIRFQVGDPALPHGSLQIFTMTGRKVRTYDVGAQARSCMDLTWDGNDEVGHACPAAMYICRLTGPVGSPRYLRFLLIH